jgi:lipooligosaccharide transport system permease protein
MFLFSGTFFPLEQFPEAVRLLIQLTPLYHGVELLRGLAVGVVGPATLVHVGYLTVMGLLGISIVARRLDKLLLK